MFAKWSCHQRGSPLDKPTAAQTVKDVEEDCFLPCPANISSTATHFSDFDGQTATLLLLLLTKKRFARRTLLIHNAFFNLESRNTLEYNFMLFLITFKYFAIFLYN